MYGEIAEKINRMTLEQFGEFIIDVCEAYLSKKKIAHAHWLYDAVDSDGTGDYFCSVCNRNVAVKYTYCPHCGARMDGEGLCLLLDK